MFHETLSKQVESKIPFILSHVDRDPFSKTYGCCDRLFWGWKLKDYPDATHQRYVYPLAKFLHHHGMLNNEHLKTLIAIFRYSKLIQHNNGSIDQAFPNECSHAGTGFLLFDLVRAYELINDQLDQSDRDWIIDMMTQMGEYLLKRNEEHGFISNHLAGVGVALAYLGRVVENESYKRKAKIYVDRVIQRQSSEGWYLEYEGADPGYQSLGIYYLSHYYKVYPSSNLLDSLKSAIEFVSYFVHPDGSYGGEYGSRNTEIFYTGGFAIMSDEIPLAANILAFMLKSIQDHKTPNLNGIDNGNLAPLMNNYLDVIDADKAFESSDSLCFEKVFTKEFRDAGIVIHSSKSYYNIIGISKGGVIKGFDKQNKKLVIDDCGYIGLLGKKQVSTQTYSTVEYKMDDAHIELNAPFFVLNQTIPTPGSFLLLRLFNLSFGKVYWLSELVKRILVQLLISGKKKTKATLTRSIELKDSLIIEDSINSEEKILNLKNGVKFSSIHMASSKYWAKGY